jgi:hypothetical protein
MEQQRNQKMAQEQHDEGEEIQHGPFPVEQLQVLPISHISSFSIPMLHHESWARPKFWALFSD